MLPMVLALGSIMRSCSEEISEECAPIGALMVCMKGG